MKETNFTPNEKSVKMIRATFVFPVDVAETKDSILGSDAIYDSIIELMEGAANNDFVTLEESECDKTTIKSFSKAYPDWEIIDKNGEHLFFLGDIT